MGIPYVNNYSAIWGGWSKEPCVRLGPALSMVRDKFSLEMEWCIVTYRETVASAMPKLLNQLSCHLDIEWDRQGIRWACVLAHLANNG